MFNVFLFTLGLFIALTLLLGIFTVIKNPKSKPAQLWFLISISMLIWSIGHFLHLTAADPAQATFYAKLLYAGVVFLPVLFYHFTLIFLLVPRDLFKNSFLAVGYVVSVILAYLSLTTNLIVSGVSPKFDFPQWLDAGSLHFLLLIHFWIFVFVTIKMLLQYINKKDGVMRRKTFYILLAALIGFLTGGTNFLPQTIGWYPFGSFFAWVYVVLVAYGVYSDGLKIKI